jgi:hypothetical protein
MGEQEISADGEDKKILYEKFQHDYLDYSSLKPNTFSKWLKCYCSIKNYTMSETRSHCKTFIYITKQGAKCKRWVQNILVVLHPILLEFCQNSKKGAKVQNIWRFGEEIIFYGNYGIESN